MQSFINQTITDESIRMNSIVQDFFTNNDLPHCIEMENTMLNDSISVARSRKKQLKGIVFYHTQIIELLVKLSEFRKK